MTAPDKRPAVEYLPPLRRARRGPPDNVRGWAELADDLDRKAWDEADISRAFVLGLAAYGAARLAAERTAEMACMCGRRG